MDVTNLCCPGCAYKISREDIIYGSCPCCGTSLQSDEVAVDKIVDGTSDIKDANGNIVGSAKIPRGYQAEATFYSDNMDKVTPRRLKIDLKGADGSVMFYESGSSYVQMKSGIYNDATGEFSHDLNARKRNFCEPSEFLDKLAEKMAGARINVEYTRQFPIEDMGTLRNIFLNASAEDIRKATAQNHGTRFRLDDFYFDGLVKVYSYNTQQGYRYLTLGTMIRGDEISVSLSTAASLADTLETTRDITGKISQVTNASHGFVGNMAGRAARRMGFGAVMAIPGAINGVNRFINQSGVIDLLDNVKDKEVTEDETSSLITPDASDGSNEGFGNHRPEGAKVSYISWGYECIIGMYTSGRPDERQLQGYDEFIQTLNCNTDLNG